MKRQILTNKLLPVAAAASMMIMSLQVAHADLTDPSNNLYGSGTTTYSIMNTSVSAATVVATYYNPDGSSALTQNFPSLAALGRTDVSVASVGLPTQWSGSVILSSDQDIVAAAVTYYTGKNTVADSSTAVPGTELSAYEAFNIGSNTLFAPALFRVPPPPSDSVAAKQVTRFTIQNTTSSTANYTITYRARDGFLLGTYSSSLNANGSRTFETRKNSDLPASVLTNLVGRVGGGGFSAQVNSDQPLVGTSETVANLDAGPILANWSGDHTLQPPSNAANVLFSPAAFRFCNNTPTALANCQDFANINNHYLDIIQYSSFQLQNTTANTANVTADFINRATGQISATVPFTISAFSGFGINLFNGGGLPLTSTLFPALGSRFAGSVRFTSDQPLVGTGNVDFPTTPYYGSYNLIGSSDASSTVLAPVFNRVCPNNSSAQCNGNTLPNFDKVSVAQIMNVGNSAVTINSIDLINSNGSISLTLTTKGNGSALTLQPGQALGLNLFNGGDFNTTQFDTQLAYGFMGSLRVNGPVGSQLKAIVEYRNANLGMDQYNAFNR